MGSLCLPGHRAWDTWCGCLEAGPGRRATREMGHAGPYHRHDCFPANGRDLQGQITSPNLHNHVVPASQPRQLSSVGCGDLVFRCSEPVAHKGVSGSLPTRLPLSPHQSHCSSHTGPGSLLPQDICTSSSLCLCVLWAFLFFF